MRPIQEGYVSVSVFTPNTATGRAFEARHPDLVESGIESFPAPIPTALRPWWAEDKMNEMGVQPFALEPLRERLDALNRARMIRGNFSQAEHSEYSQLCRLEQSLLPG